MWCARAIGLLIIFWHAARHTLLGTTGRYASIRKWCRQVAVISDAGMMHIAKAHILVILDT
jgi:hypothetical protein